MKKHLPLLLALVLLFSLTACGKPVEKENPYRIKTYTLDSYENGELVNRSEYVYTYNDQGYILQRNLYQNGTLAQADFYEHDTYGNVIFSKTELSDGSVRALDYKLTLDNEYRPIREECYEDGVLSNTIEYAYDRYGNQIQRNIIRVHMGENNISWIDYAYDKDGNLIQQTTRWNNGTEGITKENTANVTTHKWMFKDGKLSRSETYNRSEELEEYADYTYDDTGLIQTMLRYEGDGFPYSKCVTTFDEYGNELTIKYYRLLDNGINIPDDLVDLVYTTTYDPIPETK